MGLRYLLCLYLAFPLTEGVGEVCNPSFKRYSTSRAYCLPRNASCDILSSGVSMDDISVILQEHNSYRSRVATGKETIYELPRAANMMQMVWDNALAGIAQGHADQCRFKHDCAACRRTESFESVGQNLFQRSSAASFSKPDWPAAVKKWYKEVKDFDKDQIQNYQGSKVVMAGHFTQVVWADSWRIGCGYTHRFEGGKHKELYTCNYGPGGNCKGKPMYQSGNTCGNCPLNSCCNRSCKRKDIVVDYRGLCKILDGMVPQYAPSPGLIFSCSFNDEPDCARIMTSGVGRWTVTETSSGSYIGIVLKGGQFSTLNFTTPFKGQKSVCFSYKFRKGSVDETEETNNVVFELFSTPHQEIKIPLKANEKVFKKRSTHLNWNVETKFAIRFIVPPWRPAQYFELKDLMAKEGEC